MLRVMKQRRRHAQNPAPIRPVEPRELARVAGGHAGGIGDLPSQYVEPPPNTDAKVWQDDWLAPV